MPVSSTALRCVTNWKLNPWAEETPYMLTWYSESRCSRKSSPQTCSFVCSTFVAPLARSNGPCSVTFCPFHIPFINRPVHAFLRTFLIGPSLASLHSSTLAFLGDSPPATSSSSALRLVLSSTGASGWGCFFLRTRPVRSVAVFLASSTRAWVSAADSPRAAPRMPPMGLASPPRSAWASMGSLRRSTSLGRC